MFEQLKLLLNRQSLRGEENQGRVLDWLKQIGHFKRLDSHLGSDYLLVLLPILQPFVLRKGFTLINENDLYVLLQGDLRASQALLGGNICVQCGICIDLKNSRNLIYAAFNDCKMIRILRNAGNMVKTYKKLQELERQRVKKFKEYQKLITQPWNQMKLGIISRSAFFSKLGQYDAYQFALGCSFKQYSQFMVTHEGSGSYNKIGYIVSGKIKMSLLNGQDHRKDQQIYWFLNQGDWIGLEDYLWNKSQESSGEVQTTAAAILWIPFYIFQAKFNARTNCDTINKLIGLIKTKKLLFDRSVNCRRKKYQEMEIQANSKLQLNPQLQAKIQALQPQPERKKTYFSKNRVDSSNKREVTYPQKILHTQMQTNEPRIPPHFDSKTIVLFPQEYANSPVDPSYQKQMNRIKFIIDKTKEKQRQSSIELSPQINYNTICQRITFRIKQENRSRQLTPQRKLSQEKKTHRKSSNHHSYKTRLHLYNDTPPKTKTLQILT